MWRETVRRTGNGNFTCYAKVPNIAHMQIVQFRNRSGEWSTEQFKYVRRKLRDAVRRKEVLLTYDDMYAYIRSHMPGIDDSYHLELDNMLLRDRINADLKARKNELAERPELFSARDDIDSHIFTSGEYIECLVDSNISKDVADGLNPQESALEFLETEDAELAATIIQNLSSYDAAIKYIRTNDHLNSSGDLVTVNDICYMISCEGIIVSNRTFNNMSYTEFIIEVVWDEEHRVSVVLHGDRLVHIGDSSGGWQDMEAGDKDMPTPINPFTGKPI